MALFFTIVVLGTLLLIGLGLSQIVTSQMRQIQELGLSVKAFYVADKGIEEALYKMYRQGQSPPFQFGANPQVRVCTLTNCPYGFVCNRPYYCIRSSGSFQGIFRLVEAGG